MRTLRLLLLGGLLVVAAIPSPARAGGEIMVYGIRHEPVGRIDDFVDGSWGGGAEIAWKWSNQAPGLWAGLGGEYVSLHNQQTGSGGRKEDYFRIFGGPRWLYRREHTLQPYWEAHLSAVRHAVATTFDSGNQGTGFLDWGMGYDVGVGLHLNPFERMTGFVGVRWLQSFGLQGDPPDDDIQFDPTYWNVYGGIGWTFGFLDVN